MQLSKFQNNHGFFDRLKNGVDSVIEVFSPEMAFHRRQARAASQMMLSSGRSGYAGASNDRKHQSWFPGGGSADTDLLNDLPLLRERSRDLIRNAGFAAGTSNTFALNIVGSGIRPQSRLKTTRLGIDDKTAESYQEQFETLWDNWVRDADATEGQDFYELQDLIIRQIVENGDVIILPLRVKRPGVPYSLCVQVVEADRLMTPPDKMADKNVKSGVHIGDRGQPVGYWIKKTHPGDITGEVVVDDFQYYPAKDKFGKKNIFHLYWKLRPGQTRGMPILSPVLNLFKDISELSEAQLLKEKIAACFCAFIKKMDPLAAANQDRQTTGAGANKNTNVRFFEPGKIEYLGLGEDIVTPTPPGVAGNYDPFMQGLLREMAAAIGVPYEILSRNFNGLSYSTARTIMLDAIKFFKNWQNFLSKRLNQPVWEMVLEEAYIKGEILIQTFYLKFYEWTRVKWQGNGWAWVDPLKEVQANKEALAAQIKTHAQVSGETGDDWEDNFRQIALEKKKRAELGLGEPDYNSKTVNQNFSTVTKPPAGENKNIEGEDNE